MHLSCFLGIKVVLGSRTRKILHYRTPLYFYKGGFYSEAGDDVNNVLLVFRNSKYLQIITQFGFYFFVTHAFWLKTLFYIALLTR